MSALKICPQCGSEYELDQRFCPKDGSTLKLQGPVGDLVGSVINKSYHVLRKLGEGGMGTVYLAEHVKMGRKSALKVMNPGMVNDADAISRFNREAANASKISHPNVAAVYDFGETEDGLIFLAMEFIEGPSLSSVIKEGGALAPQRAADITRQAGDALAIAHDMGIVHRDLKPDNIMLAKNRDGTDLVKVVDFGIAKAANNEAQKVTRTGLIVGTPEYMSPEQLAADKLDGRSDTYSLALVAFNMFTGQLPFPGGTAQESMIMRLTDEPKRLVEMKPDVSWPAAVQAVMDKALQRDAAHRYQTANEFGRELSKAVSAMRGSGATAVMSPASVASTDVHAPTTVIPKTRVSSTPRNAPVVPPEPKRNRTPVMAAVALVVLLGGGGAGYFMIKGKGEARANPVAPQGDTSRLNQQVTSPPLAAAVNVPRELESIASMPDTNQGVAREQLARLTKIDSVASVSDDSTFLQFRYMRGKALMASGDQKAGCDSLKTLESRLMKSRFKNAVRPILTLCSQ